MFKKFVLLVVIVVFAKPAYDAVTTFSDGLSSQLGAAKELVSDLPMISEYIQPEHIEEVKKSAVALQNITTTIIQEVATSPSISSNSQTASTQTELADAFYNAFSNWQTEFDIEYKGNTENIEQTIEQAVNAALANDDYILGHTNERNITFSYNKLSAEIHVKQSYLTNAQQEQIVDERVKTLTSSWQGLSNFAKVRAVNDYIVRQTAYTKQSATSEYSAYSVLVEGKGVCQGYALLALKMLRELGVETKYIVGYVGDVGHAWNLVKLDGQWYHVDTTWNDPVPDRGQAVSYKYLLVDDTTIARDHSWVKADYPRATSTRFANLHVADFTVEQNGTLYYSHIRDNDRLYKMNLAVLQPEKLTNSRAVYVAVSGNWVYFSNYSRGGYIAKMTIDGRDESIVYDKKSKDLFVKDSYLYFTANGQQRMRLD